MRTMLSRRQLQARFWIAVSPDKNFSWDGVPGVAQAWPEHVQVGFPELNAKAVFRL
jgi:hypothetical protein